MKTTIDLPDDILHQAKIVAAQRKTTLRELVVLGLGYAITRSASDPVKERKAVLQELLTRMQATNTEPMIPLKRSEIYDR